MNDTIFSTEKLYYLNAYTASFEAKVISCTKIKEHYEVILDKTAFFPNQGGQPSDTGLIASSNVLSVTEKNGVIYHTTDAALKEGSSVICSLDFKQRFVYMQTHSAEHIVSGIIYKLFGFTNVGFHINMDSIGCTMDYSGALTQEQLQLIEKEANETVYRNLRINQLFPSENELSLYPYRSKLELTENVRLIEIPGIDLCACCAPHVSFTGEIGLIKLLSSMSHRGGTRICMAAGSQAFNDYVAKYDDLLCIAALLSTKHNEASSAVTRILGDYSHTKKELARISTTLAILQANDTKPENGNICYFTRNVSGDTLREIVNSFLPRCDGFCCAFSGDDEIGYSYVIGSTTQNLSLVVKEINSALSGKGGGKPEMVQGSAKASEALIRAYFKQNMLIC